MKRSSTTFSRIILFAVFILSIQQFNTKAQTSGWQLYTKINEVSQLVSDGNTLWIASVQGLVRLDKTTLQHTNYDAVNSGLPASYVRSIVSDGTGGVWGGTSGGGVFHFDGTQWQIYNNSTTPEIKTDAIANIFRDSNGNIWITYPQGSFGTHYVTKFDGTNWTSQYFANEVYKISQANNGDILIGSSDGFYTYNGTSWSQTSSTMLGFPSAEKTNKVVQDSKNNYWLATDDSGLVKYDGTNITSYTTSNSQISYNVQQNIKIDGNDNIYLLPGINGFQKFDGTNWTTYNKSNDGLISDAVTDVILDGSKTWAGIAGGYAGFGGLDLFDGTSWSEVPVSNSGIPSNFISSVAFRNNNGTVETWVGTQDHGIASFDGTNWTTYNKNNSGLGEDATKSLAVDKSGKVWIGTPDLGVFVFDVLNNTWTNYDKNNTSMGSNDIRGIKIDTTGVVDTVWVINGFFGYGISKYDGTNWNFYRPQNGLSITFTKIDEDKEGNIWLASNSGIYRFDGANWTSWTKSSSNLKSDNINDIKATSLGVVAAVANSGIAVFNPDSSDWVNYDNTNSPLTLDNVQVISEVPDTVKYANTSTFSLKKQNSDGFTEAFKFLMQLMFGGQYYNSSTNQEQSEAIDFLKTVRKTANPLALAAGLLFSDNLSKGESDFLSADIHYIQGKIKIALGTSTEGVAVNDNTSIPEDPNLKDKPKINNLIINQVMLEHHNADKGGMTKVDVTPGNKGAFLTVEGVESEGTKPKQGSTPKILVEDLYIPDLSKVPNSVIFGFRTPEYLPNAKTAILDAYLSTTPLNGSLLPIEKLSAEFLATVGVTSDDAIGVETDPKETITDAGIKPNTPPDNIPVIEVNRFDFPSLDLDNSTNPPQPGVFAGDFNACVPTGTANSLRWLEDIYPDISLPQGKSLRDIMEELSSFMKRKDTTGVFPLPMVRGKLDFIEQYNLPLDVKFQSEKVNDAIVKSTSGNSFARNFNGANKKPTWQFLKQQMLDGEDIELNYYWSKIDTNKTTGVIDTAWYGHCENVVGLREYANGRKELFLKSDLIQRNAGGVKITLAREVWVGNDGFMHFESYGYTMKITTIVAESPQPKEGRAAAAFINEIFANNGGAGNVAAGTTTTPEFIEVALDTNITDLDNYRVSLYDSTGKVYDVKTLDQFTKGSVKDSIAVYYYNYSGGIQNKGGVSLMYSGSPLPGQFVSYGNSFTADSGDATGLQSDSIGISSTGMSLALAGSGINYSDFTWGSSSTPTPGDFNPGQSILTGIEDTKVIPVEYSLSQNYPNPFNPSTKIKYSLPENAHVKIEVYDILGRLVTTLLNAEQKTGVHIINFDASRISSGVYFYQIVTPKFTQTKKMILLK